MAEHLSTHICDGLRYAVEPDGLWHPLSQWSRFLVELGAMLAAQGSARNRIVAALALPTRAYAAALAALGAVVARSSIADPHAGSQEHFRQLALLQLGAPVTYRRYNRELKGLFLGSREAGGRLEVGVKVENNLAYWVGVEHCEKIQVSQEVRPEAEKRQYKMLPLLGPNRRTTQIGEFLFGSSDSHHHAASEFILQ